MTTPFEKTPQPLSFSSSEKTTPTVTDDTGQDALLAQRDQQRQDEYERDAAEVEAFVRARATGGSPDTTREDS